MRRTLSLSTALAVLTMCRTVCRTVCHTMCRITHGLHCRHRVCILYAHAHDTVGMPNACRALSLLMVWPRTVRPIVREHGEPHPARSHSMDAVLLRGRLRRFVSETRDDGTVCHIWEYGGKPPASGGTRNHGRLPLLPRRARPPTSQTACSGGRMPRGSLKRWRTLSLRVCGCVVSLPTVRPTVPYPCQRLPHSRAYCLAYLVA